MKSIDPECNRYRFYTIFLQKNLFDQYYLVRHWGRIGTRGSSKSMIFDTYEEAADEISRLMKIRRAHGYN